MDQVCHNTHSFFIKLEDSCSILDYPFLSIEFNPEHYFKMLLVFSLACLGTGLFKAFSVLFTNRKGHYLNKTMALLYTAYFACLYSSQHFTILDYILLGAALVQICTFLEVFKFIPNEKALVQPGPREEANLFDGIFIGKCLFFGAINLYTYFYPPYWNITELDFTYALINIGLETSILSLSALVSSPASAITSIYIPIGIFVGHLVQYLSMFQFSILEGIIFLSI